MRSSVAVLIVGGGPVGLSLALEIGSRNVPCLLVEQGDGAILEAKMFATGIRTLEFCRRWGIAERVKNWGFPPDYKMDIVFVTSLAGHELGRIAIPSQRQVEAFDCSPEQFAHCPQFVFDPILAEAARSRPSVHLRYRCRLTGFRQDDTGVFAELHDLETDRREMIEASYLVGCDGLSSSVRKALGIEMTGQPMINRSANIMFRAPRLTELHDKGEAGRYVILGPAGPWASLVPADGVERWRLMVHGRADVDMSGIDPLETVRRAIGRDADVEILTVGHWVRRRLAADRYQHGRVFLAGDAVHVTPPNGGLGMNTGIGDAVDLGWKLAAVHQGWGGFHLLDTYERERRPIGVRACDEAMRNFERFSTRAISPHIFDETEGGDRARAELGAQLVEANRYAWDNPLDTHLGYRYDQSPICIPDGPPPPPPADTREYTQTSFPGARAPHAWLKDGRSTLDLFGDGFTLLRLGNDAPDAAKMAQAARDRGVPLQIVAVEEEHVLDLYEKPLVLVRPDGHVAWRGSALSDDMGGIIDRVRGAEVTADSSEATPALPA